MASSLNSIGRQLANGLARIRTHEDALNVKRNDEEKINVVGAGGAVTAAYEQLRNAAENTEEHLLLQNAIKRFYKQLFVTRDEELIRTSGNELAVELTLAGYIPNNSLTRQQVDTISQLATQYYHAYEQLPGHKHVSRDQAANWTIGVLAVEAESVINSHASDDLFVETAYNYLQSVLTPKHVFGRSNVADFAAAMLVAIYRALLKVDDATVRTVLLRRYQVTPDNLTHYISTNRGIDALIQSQTSDKLFHAVDRQGAPLRILRRLIESRDDAATLLKSRHVFLDEFEKQVNVEYNHVGQRINRAVIRSVIFLIITKFLIGVAIEVPYDYWHFGYIEWMPLLINLLFPPLYMILLKFTFTLPSYANTTALVDHIDRMLYGDQELMLKSAAKERRYSSVFSIIYALVGLLVFAFVTWVLLLLKFSFVHIVIFFIFLSAASFLGFRLSRLIRELEVVRAGQNGMTVVRDFLYLPFVVVGRWMSDKYSKVNIVTLILDMLIELPLKTILRLVRQWSAFIDDRKDNL